MKVSSNKKSFGCLFLFTLTVLLSISCERDRDDVDGVLQFYVHGTDAQIFANNRAALAGEIDFSRPVRLEYWFSDDFFVPPNSSMQIEYEFNFLPSHAIRENYSLVLSMGAVAWELPMDVNRIKYSIPISDTFNGRFSIELAANGFAVIPADGANVFTIRSISFVERRFGFIMTEDEYFFTPFVNRTADGRYVIDVPPEFLPANLYEQLEATFTDAVVIETGGRRIESFPRVGAVYIPPALYPVNGRASISGQGITSFIMNFSRIPEFPVPIKADPVHVVHWPQGRWRDERFEIFRWPAFPSLVMFDFVDFDMQARMLKRMAFFVEKTGFRGRLPHDYEIADLHGWNAHDYRAYDLARFFDTARRENFPLLYEERLLERILLNEGIIRDENGRFVEGEGAIFSIAREFPWLRYRFMAHEGFHGLFFIDEDFREFTRERWEQFSEPGRIFFLKYLDTQEYDIEHEFLVLKEFKGHILQQTVAQAADYFGRHLPVRMYNDGLAYYLPERHPNGTFPYLASVFTVEAQVFSEYVEQRWGFAAGRVWAFRLR